MASAGKVHKRNTARDGIVPLSPNAIRNSGQTLGLLLFLDEEILNFGFKKPLLLQHCKRFKLPPGRKKRMQILVFNERSASSAVSRSVNLSRKLWGNVACK